MALLPTPATPGGERATGGERARICGKRKRRELRKEGRAAKSREVRACRFVCPCVCVRARGCVIERRGKRGNVREPWVECKVRKPSTRFRSARVQDGKVERRKSGMGGWRAIWRVRLE
eukprot:4612268-Pleurochrysis_carterae.AAC.2